MGKDLSRKETLSRIYLAVGLTVFSVCGISALAVAIVCLSDDVSDAARMVLAAVLPLFGSWVGTVLAYYFSKENFEAATRSVTELARVSLQERLESTPLRDKMISKSEMFYVNLPADQIKLLETLKALAKSKKGNRLPVLNDKDQPVYILHRSAIDRYLVKAAGKPSPPDLSSLTLADLLTDSELTGLAEESFATVREDGTLADAKNAMSRTPNCQDVFVTKRGTKYEEVLGWITNVIIEEYSKV